MALSFDPVFGTFQLPNVPIAPANEYDVQIESKPKKTKSQKPYPARPTPPALVSDGRGFQSVNSPTPTEQPDMRAFGIGNGTGKGYDGPFVSSEQSASTDEQPTPTDERDGLLPRNTIASGKPGGTSETFLSRLIRPPEGELEAARNGMRWHWALQNRWMLPGSKWNETVWNGVDRENKYIAGLLRQKGDSIRNSSDVMSPVARARLMALDKNKWDKFIDGIKQGHYSSQGELTPEAKEYAEKFQRDYATKWGDDALVDLTPIPGVFGKRTDLMKKQNFDLRTQMQNTEDIMDNIYKWSVDGSWNDPVKQNVIKNYLDKVSQALSSELGGDSKSMADAEKIRIQILYLPEESMENVKQEIANYRDFLSSVMNYGRQKGWSQNIIGKINRGKEGLDMAVKANGKGNISTLAGEALSTIGDILPSLTPSERELAVGLTEALNAGIEAHKAYMQNMVLAADVDPSLVYQFAELLHDRQAARYNREMIDAERPERAKATAKYDVDLKNLSRQVKPSPLLKPTDYKKLLVEISRPERSGGNPQGNIEQNGTDGIVNNSSVQTLDSIDLGK